jgi:hypothetical protein
MPGLSKTQDSVKLNPLIAIRTFVIRGAGVCLLLAASAAAQDAAPNAAGLAALEQTARQKSAEWDRLAQGLDASIRGLLPCDPKAAAAITNVSKASEARLAALLAYLQEAGRQKALQTAAARRILASVEPLGPDLPMEKLDLEQEQLGVQGQTTALSDSAQRRSSFNGAQEALRHIASLEQQRSDAVDSAISHTDATAAAVRAMLAQLAEQETALKETQAAFVAEGARWSAYYSARLERAQTECNITKGVIATPAQPRGKQK